MSREVKPIKTFVIRHKETHELWVASSGKTSWRAKNHAASAWCYGKGKNEVLGRENYIDCACKGREHVGCWKCRYSDDGLYRPRFAEQDVYECVELKQVQAVWVVLSLGVGEPTPTLEGVYSASIEAVKARDAITGRLSWVEECPLQDRFEGESNNE